jgi:ABC-type multidrug transport system ATPase subunit
MVPESGRKIDRVCIIDHGKVLAIDTPTALKTGRGQELLRAVPEDESNHEGTRALDRGHGHRRRHRSAVRRCVPAAAGHFARPSEAGRRLAHLRAHALSAARHGKADLPGFDMEFAQAIG